MMPCCHFWMMKSTDSSPLLAGEVLCSLKFTTSLQHLPHATWWFVVGHDLSYWHYQRITCLLNWYVSVTCLVVFTNGQTTQLLWTRILVHMWITAQCPLAFVFLLYKLILSCFTENWYFISEWSIEGRVTLFFLQFIECEEITRSFDSILLKCYFLGQFSGKVVFFHYYVEYTASTRGKWLLIAHLPYLLSTCYAERVTVFDETLWNTYCN